jgi:hypothetical protein
MSRRIMETATFIIGISQGHDIEFIIGSIPGLDSVEQRQFHAGKIPIDVCWPTVTLLVQGTRQQCLVIFNALAGVLDEPEYSDEE